MRHSVVFPLHCCKRNSAQMSGTHTHAACTSQERCSPATSRAARAACSAPGSCFSLAWWWGLRASVCNLRPAAAMQPDGRHCSFAPCSPLLANMRRGGSSKIFQHPLRILEECHAWPPSTRPSRRGAAPTAASQAVAGCGILGARILRRLKFPGERRAAETPYFQACETLVKPLRAVHGLQYTPTSFF